MSSLLIFAVVLFGLSVRASSPSAGLAVALATALCAAAFWIEQRGNEMATPTDSGRQEARLLVAVLTFSFLGVVGWAPSWIGTTSDGLERLPGMVWALLAILVFISRRSGYTRIIFATVTVLALAITLIVGILHLDGARGIGLDVYLLHRETASAIAEGQNPYTDVVEVPNGAPTASPGDTIVGYPYPPVTAIAYSLGEWSLDDPRYTSLGAWLAVLGLIGASAYRRRSRQGLYVLLLLASIPGWPLVLRAAWTEPVTLLFLVVAFLAWRRPVGSGVALGLGLASKQYFALAAPLALLHRDEGWLRRLLMAATVVAFTVVPAVLLDQQAFLGAAVEFHANTPLRTDSVNLVGAITNLGVDWEPHRWLAPIVGLVVAAVAGRLSRTRQSFFIAMSIALAGSFLVSSQAFANYWFLITGLVALCIPEVRQAVSTPETEPQPAHVSQAASQ